MPEISRSHTKQKLGIVDFGGQYAHLIASRVRRLGAYCEILLPNSVQAARITSEYSGLILSGGPESVYENRIPTSHTRYHLLDLPILGICYGHQLLIHQNGKKIVRSQKSEYGHAKLELQKTEAIFEGERLDKKLTVWMSHGDEVQSLPIGFEVLGKTKNCPYAAIGDLRRKHFGLQFHPEVMETEGGNRFLSNFIRICGLKDTWKLIDFLKEEEANIQKQVKNRKIFFLLSGGVDSTVAFSLLARSMDMNSQLIGLHIDTGFMRTGEIEEVKEAMKKLGVLLNIVDASKKFYTALNGVFDPEEKRKIIGELFVKVQQEASQRLGLNTEEWCLGQGTIYPDQIESGASQHSHQIKTHHNRVAGIQALMGKGLVVEPIARLYKDEVRELGRLLGLPNALLMRHPFPGPGLAVRCLCRPKNSKPFSISQELQIALAKECRPNNLDFQVLPIRSVGVQGDKRSYRHCIALFYRERLPEWPKLLETARRIPNSFFEFNRVIVQLGASKAFHFAWQSSNDINPERIEFLRKADALVRHFLFEKKIYDKIWQFPVVSLPIYPVRGDTHPQGDAIVLRPILSTDAMTASVYPMSRYLLFELYERFQKELPECSGVFYDLTNKPPGTIEWE